MCSYDNIPPNASSCQSQPRIHSATNHTTKGIPETEAAEENSDMYQYQVFRFTSVTLTVLNDSAVCEALTMSYHQTSSRTRRFHSSTKTAQVRGNLEQIQCITASSQPSHVPTVTNCLPYTPNNHP